MPSSPVQRAPTPEYLNTVEREEELERLRNQARIRKSLLVHGSEGVGKSRLLQNFIGSQPLAVYIPQMRSPREFAMTLLQALHSADGKVKLPGNIAALSTSSLKGIVHRALDTQPFLMVLDHLDAPSRVVTGMIKDLHYYGRTPVIFASRSPHMEDIGALRPLCANKAERLEVKNFPPQVALEFAQREAERTELWASNLETVLSSLVEWSDGNPGAILHLLKMAQLPQYRAGDQIKSHILYVDYRMGRR
ncbi:MAG: AAA family ATPase [Terracidiphilus sp.]|jgi:GTPase SAR1 family protein